jgi:hypothetical protein
MTDASRHSVLAAGGVDITPDRMLPLFGREGRVLAARSVASRLEANCLLFQGAGNGPAALVAIDSLYPSAALVAAVTEACAARGLLIAAECLMIVASHTHNAPALDPSKPKLGEFDPSYLAFVASRISDCLLQLSRQTPDQGHAVAKITNFASGQAVAAASVYRRKAIWGLDLASLRPLRRMVMAPNNSSPIGQSLKLLVLTDDASRPRAVLWSWPCHAVSEPEALAISADFPGALRAHIRERLAAPNLPVLYLPGFSGDIRPYSETVLPLHRARKWIGIGRRFAKANPACAEALQRALETAFAEAERQLKPVGKVAEARLRRSRRSLDLAELRKEAGDLAPLTCDVWRFGPIQIRAVSAEVASEYAPIARGDDPLAFSTGCAGQVFGYIPSDRQLSEGGYEVEGFATSFSVPGCFRTAIEDKVSWLIGG